MSDKLTHLQHKWILTVLFTVTLVAGIMFARYLVGRHPDYDVIITLMFGLIVAIGMLIVVILSILTRLEEEFYWHHKKL